MAHDLSRRVAVPVLIGLLVLAALLRFLDLGAVPLGSFDDTAVCRLIGLPDGEAPRYLFAVGRPA